MTNSLTEVTAAINLLAKKPKTFGWQEFTDSGNSCVGRLDVLGTQQEVDDYAEHHSLVLRAMPKGSELHKELNKAVAGVLCKNWIVYDTLVKMTARILQGIDTLDELKMYAQFTELVQEKMREKGIKEISSMEELFA